MPSFSQETKEQIRQAVDIVDLVGGYMQLRPQGRGYVGLCPFHDDKRPSMQVNPERQSFKCWVCQTGGDIFSFIMNIEGVEFRQALEILADRAGISLEQMTNGPRPEPGSPGDKKTLFAAMAWAEELYHKCLLQSPEAEMVKQYLAERDISQASIDRFRIGFAPTGWDWLLSKAQSAGFSPAVLERVNLISQSKNRSGWYDQFRGRLIFPIRDVRSRPVALGGRVIPKIAEAESNPNYTPAKYVNTSETPIYSKSNTLYALDLARETIQKQNQIVVVEGYTDVVAAHQFGITNAVAACGTAMGMGQLNLLRRFTDRVALVLDGDEAGRKRASELLELFIASPVDLRILTLPDGLDPCDFISEQGADRFNELLANAPDALEHKLLSVTNGMELSADNTHAASQAVEQLLSTLAKLTPSLGNVTSEAVLREQSVLGRLARHFRLPEERLRSRLAELRSATKSKPLFSSATQDDPSTRKIQLSDLSAWDREALELLVTDPNSAESLLNQIGEVDFQSVLAQRIFSYCRQSAEQGLLTPDKLLLEVENEQLKSLLIQLDESARERAGSDLQLRIKDLLQHRDDRNEVAERGEQITAIRKGELNHDEADEAVIALFASRKRRESGPLSTDG